MPATQTTRLGRKWLFKMLMFLVVALALAVWGYYDAAVSYPKRGARAAALAEFKFLDHVTQGGVRAAIVSFDPKQEFGRLSSAGAGLSMEDRLKQDWLTQLKLIGQLDATHTNIPDAIARRKQLTASVLTSAGQPVAAPPLAWYDIPLQWLICATGAGLALWLAFHIARVARRRYSWDDGEKRLYLPDGSSLVPADIAEFDKRKWDKFLIYLHIKPHHDRHGGRELMLDLYQHAPLEDWVLEMERIASPETAEPPPGRSTPEEEPAAAQG